MKNACERCEITSDMAKHTINSCMLERWYGKVLKCDKNTKVIFMFALQRKDETPQNIITTLR